MGGSPAFPALLRGGGVCPTCHPEDTVLPALSPGAAGPSGKPVQLVHRASREEEPGTLRARPRAVQLRWGRHRSELELLAEKVPVGHGWHCVFWLGVPDRKETRAGQLGCLSPNPRPLALHPPGAVTPAPGGHCACSRQKPACA